MQVTERLHIRIEDENHTKLKILAVKQKTSMSKIIRRLVATELKKVEKQEKATKQAA